MAVGERDPVSVLWDGPARALLRRAIDAKGEWQGTRIADPSERQRAMIRALGINVNARDNPSAQGGRARGGHGINAKTRWARGFVRAVFYHNDRRHGGRGRSLELEVGRYLPAGAPVPAGYAVRLRTVRGGSVARRAAQRLPEEARIYTDAGGPGMRWSDPGLRDW